MDIIKESPLDFNSGEEADKAGNIYIDTYAGLAIYWQTDTAWQYIPMELADAFLADQNATTKMGQDLVEALNLADRTKKELKETTSSLGHAQKDMADALDSIGTLEREAERENKDLDAANKELERASVTIKNLAKQSEKYHTEAAHLKKDKLVLAEQVDELETKLEEKAPALEAQDLVDLRATCTVDEVLRMRAAGVL